MWWRKDLGQAGPHSPLDILWPLEVMGLGEPESWASELGGLRQGQREEPKARVGQIWVQISALALTGPVIPKQVVQNLQASIFSCKMGRSPISP